MIADIEPESRITVVSDLNLVVSPIKTNLEVGGLVDLSFALKEENAVVTRPEFLNILAIDVTVRHLEQKQDWSQRLTSIPSNGIFTADLDYFQTVGQYQVIVKVDGKSFQRQFTHTLTVREPFAVTMVPETIEGKTNIKVTVSPQIQTIDLHNTTVRGSLQTPSGVNQIQRFSLTEQQTWALLLSPEDEGDYELTLRIVSTDQQGNRKTIVPQPLRFTYPDNNTFLTDTAKPIEVQEYIGS